MTTKQLVMLGVIVAYVSTPAAARQTNSDCSDHTLATQGISLYYKTCGQGPPLLLLHRFFGTGTFSWGRSIPTLAANTASSSLTYGDTGGRRTRRMNSRIVNPQAICSHCSSRLDCSRLKRWELAVVA